MEETLEALESLRAAGKIRYGGCSNWTGEQLKQAHLLAQQNAGLIYCHYIFFVAKLTLTIQLKPFAELTLFKDDNI